MLPHHPNRLLETALTQLFKRLSQQQEIALQSWQGSYNHDNRLLQDLLDSLEASFNTLEQSADTSSVSSEQLTSLLKQNQSLIEQVESLGKQHLAQQATISELMSQLQKTEASNQRLDEQNQAILIQLSQWTTAYQQQNEQLTKLMTLLRG